MTKILSKIDKTVAKIRIHRTDSWKIGHWCFVEFVCLNCVVFLLLRV